MLDYLKIIYILNLKFVSKAASEFLFRLSFSFIGRLISVYVSAFGTIFVTGGFRGNLWSLCGFLKAGTSFLKMILEKIALNN